jgi:predicted MFS family arabinose efflux permease
MNTAGQVGSFVSAVFFGYAVEALHSYSLPLVGLATMTLLGAVCWLKIDATEKLVGYDAPTDENGSAH